MRIVIHGDKVVRFKTATGDEISGKTIYYGYTDSSVNGVACDKIFISDAKLNGIVYGIGDEAELYFNRYGKVDSIVKVK